MSNDQAAPGAQAPDLDDSVAEYHASRARYIRTVTADTEKRLLETVAKRRDPLKEEIANLTALARMRYETRQKTLGEYKAKAPSRVTAAGLLPPAPTDKVIPGIDRLFKTAAKAAEEFNEVNDIIKKRKEALEKMDEEIRTVVQQHTRDIIAQLESPVGLEGAFKRDPLLEQAHKRMLAAEARRAAVRSALAPAEAQAGER